MNEFSEEQVTLFVKDALEKSQGNHPFSANHLGLAETDVLHLLHEKLSKRFIESEINDIFQDVRQHISSRKISLTLNDLHTTTRNCNKCNISSSAELPKWNTVDPDIVVVVESPSLPPPAVTIMIDAFKDAKITSDQISLTYVNRCPVSRSYTEQEVFNCSPFLHSEIQLFNPKLILCLGNLAASTLFGSPLKMKDIHGEIRWLGHWPIISTYSPTYVARSADFNTSVAQYFKQDILNAKRFITKDI